MKKNLKIFFSFIIFSALCSCQSKKSESSSATDSTAIADSSKMADSAKMADSSKMKMADTSKKDTSAHFLKDTTAHALAKPVVTDITILYGTDREAISSGGADNVIYGNKPAHPGLPGYAVGYTVVTIPPNHKAGNIETPSIWKLEFREDTAKHMVEKNIHQLSDGDFDALLKRSKNGQDAFIFVHGFNNSFKDAALRTAQLAFDIHLPIAPLMFSWSSNGVTADYHHDEDRVMLAVPAFCDFIKRVAVKGNYKNIHLIAHSMGNRLIGEAMKQLQGDNTNLKIDQIIMAAPDVDINLFQLSYAKPLMQRSKRITVYSARNDWALLASKSIHGDLRLGEVGVPPPIYSFKTVDIIDAVHEKTDFLGHDRFARSPVIIADMDYLLKTDLPAAQRGIPYKKYGSYLYYYFK